MPFWSLLTLPTGSSLYNGHILPPLDDHSGGLNPYSNGRYSASVEEELSKRTGEVLILVLMEDALRGAKRLRGFTQQKES